MRWFLFVLLPLFICLSPTASLAKDTVKIRLYGDVKNMDWHFLLGHRAYWIMDNIMDGLFFEDENNKLQKQLVQDWRVSKNGKTYTFIIKNNVLWSDGQPLTAQHFVDGWQRLMTPSHGAYVSKEFLEISGAKNFANGKTKDFSTVGIKAKNNHTIEVTLDRSYFGWERTLSRPATYPQRIDLIKKLGKKWLDPGNLVTLGPYKLTQRTLGSQLTLVANEKYHGQPPHIKKIVALVIEKETSAINLFVKKQLDVLPLVTAKVSDPRIKPELAHITKPISVLQLGLLTTDKHLQNIHLRKAIAMGINKEPLPKIFGSASVPAERFIPPVVAGDSRKLAPQFDLKKARAELKKSGFDTKKDSIQLDTTAENGSKELAQYIQNQLKINLGIKINISLYDLNMVHARRSEHKSEMYLVGQFGSLLTPYHYLSIMTGPGNFSNWKNQKYDELLAGIRSTKGQKKAQLILQAEKLLLDSVASVPLVHDSIVTLVQENLKDFRVNAPGIGQLEHLSFKND